MGSLEEELGRVEELTADLSATTHEDFAPPLKYPSDGSMSLDSVEVPDAERVQHANNQLREIVGTSQWFTARYRAALALGRTADDCDVETLRRVTLRLMKSQLEEIEAQLRKRLEQLADSGVDDETREDLEQVYRLVRGNDVRRKIGEFLGYSKVEMWSDEHPILSRLPFARWIAERRLKK